MQAQQKKHIGVRCFLCTSVTGGYSKELTIGKIVFFAYSVEHGVQYSTVVVYSVVLGKNYSTKVQTILYSQFCSPNHFVDEALYPRTHEHNCAVQAKGQAAGIRWTDTLKHDQRKHFLAEVAPRCTPIRLVDHLKCDSFGGPRVPED